MRAHEKIHMQEIVKCRYCATSLSQGASIRDHEKLHVRKRHVITDDPRVHKKQAINKKKRGRPSIIELDLRRQRTPMPQKPETKAIEKEG